MSVFTIPNPLRAGGGPFGAAKVPAATLGFAASLGLLLFLPGQARAHDYSYGHAEITLGFPNGQVSLGKTWDNGPREVVVEQVTHKLPETDFDEEDGNDGAYAGDEADEADEAEDADEVIIEKRRQVRPVKKVTIIERYVEEPAYCEPVNVVRYYVPSYSSRADVVIYRGSPRRVIYAPSRVIIDRGGHGHGWHGRGGHGDRVHVIDRGYGHGSRNLFPNDQGRPDRSRGVGRQMIRVGGHPH